MGKRIKLRWDKPDIAAAVILLCFFGYLFLAFPVIRAGDTYQYEHQFVTREPVYSLIIQILQWITPYYDKVLVLLQNAFTATAIFIFWRFVRNEFKCHIITSFVVLAVLLAQYVATPLLSQSGLIMTNAILTEGFTIPLFLLFIMFFLKAVWHEENRRKHAWLSFAAAVTLSLTRGQMMVLLIAWAIVMGLLGILHADSAYKKCIAVGKIVLLLAVTFIGRSYTTKIYNYLEQGYFVDTVSGKAMMLANVLYTADREDGEAIADEGLQQLFYEIYDVMEENDALYRFAPEGLINRALHSEAVHEPINFTYFTPANDAYLDRTRGINASDFMLLRITTDEVASELMGYLMPEVLPRFISNYIALAAVGFIRTVAIVHPVLNWYAVGIYIAALALCIVRFTQDRKSKAMQFMLITLLLICGTVFGTSIMIQCLSRYMIYNFPLFYISGLMLLSECYQYYKQKRGNGYEL